MPIKISHVFVEQKCLEKNIKLLSVYINSKTKMHVQCLTCGFYDFERWAPTYQDILRGGCRKCAKNLKYTTEEVKKEFLKRNILLFSEYKGARTRLDVQCLVCGFRDPSRWSPLYDNVVHKGFGCPKCGRNLSPTLEEVRQFLFDKNIRLLSDKYKNSQQKLEVECLICGFCDFEKWHPMYNTIHDDSGGCPICARKKQKQTNLKRYGFEHPTQNAEIARKAARNTAKNYILFHWKTNEEIVCRASYERVIVDWLNETKQEFDWQIPFDMPNGQRYFCDLYLKEQNLWIEIKGYKREKNMSKWNWFHKEHLNSELWGEQKLKDLGLWVQVSQLCYERRKQRKLREKQQQSEVI